jgi:hypothetical protein
MNASARTENKTIAALRRLWNEWDPIGVVSSTADDEYNGYIEPTFQLLQRNATADEISRYLGYVVGEYMGMGEEGVKHANPAAFTARLQAWYSTRGDVRDDL